MILNLPPWIYRVKRLVTTDQTNKWCRLPYPGHPKGCPNWGIKKGCPPEDPRILEKRFELASPLYLVASWFNVEAHARRMKDIHPTWSERQCRCVLYWQGTSRAELYARINIARRMLDVDMHSTCPEGLWVNVYATARLAGLKLGKIRDLKVCQHVALLGRRVIL